MSSSAKPLPHKPLQWLPLAQLPRYLRPSPMLQDWITDSGSLTAHLITHSKGNFHVEIVRQFIGIPERGERQVLQLKRPQVALIREVILYGNDDPWVFARSVLPLDSLTGRLRHLRKQNTRPLGAFLFSQPQLLRSPIAVARINNHHRYLPAALAGDQPLWGRRSIFALDNKPLLVSEVFLPAFCAHLQ